MAKVIDFGVAKAIGQQLTDKTIYTRLSADDRHAAVHESRTGGDERVRCRHAERHLFAGRAAVRASHRDDALRPRAMRTATFDEIRRIIREEEPPKPSTRLGRLARSSRRCQPSEILSREALCFHSILISTGL